MADEHARDYVHDFHLLLNEHLGVSHNKHGHHYTWHDDLRDYACTCGLVLACAPLNRLDLVQWRNREDRDRGEARRVRT